MVESGGVAVEKMIELQQDRGAPGAVYPDSDQWQETTQQEEECHDRKVDAQVFLGDAREIHPVTTTLGFFVEIAVHRVGNQAPGKAQVGEQDEKAEKRVEGPLYRVDHREAAETPVEENAGDDQFGPVPHEQIENLMDGREGTQSVENGYESQGGYRFQVASVEDRGRHEQGQDTVDQGHGALLVHGNPATVHEVEGGYGGIAEQPADHGMTEFMDQGDEYLEDKIEARNQQDDKGEQGAAPDGQPALGSQTMGHKDVIFFELNDLGIFERLVWQVVCLLCQALPVLGKNQPAFKAATFLHRLAEAALGTGANVCGAHEKSPERVRGIWICLRAAKRNLR